MHIISIEGNIGSGKSTFIAHLKSIFSDNPDIVFVDEPVKEWAAIVDENGKGILDHFYNDQAKYAFAFQVIACISRLRLLRSIKHSPKYVIMERCLYTDMHVFAQMLHDDEKISIIEYAIYTNIFEEFREDFPISRIMYIRANTDVCMSRIAERARPGEEHISANYLKKCEIYYDTMISILNIQIPTCILDGNAQLTKEDRNIIFNKWTILMDMHTNTNAPPCATSVFEFVYNFIAEAMG